MNESHFNEIERTDAQPHLIAALEQARIELEATSRALTQGTYFAVTDQESLAV